MPMPSRTRTLKCTAVVTFVVLSLTGFSRGGHYTGHHYGHGSHSGGGGGCSSSHQDHDATHSAYDDEVELVGCATAKKPCATVAITNPTDQADTFTARVNFVADDDLTISFGSTDVTLPAHGTRTVQVPFGEDADLDSLDHCEAQPDAYPVD
ncbi:hypothetical protein [Streptomyces misionensis]|uniref:hypothetical protein n=1 Tax=Streptomyces misionensis TaxID=67331 RepID=UPI00396B9551